jgi:hypothetical protein
MSRFVRNTVAAVFLAAALQEGAAFSLHGPFDTWQVQAIGYQIGPDVGGPMNLGEEYRWNVPEIFYGYDPSFLNYFGQAGVDAIEKAVKIINSLPDLSKMTDEQLLQYPIDTRRFNYQASSLGILDLKSYALSMLIEQLGVAAPERWVWTLRSRVVIDNVPFYTTIMRNFDPITYRPTKYVNGTLYTYQILQTYTSPDIWEAVDLVPDPLAPSVTSVVSLANIANNAGTVDFRGWEATSAHGMFFDSLTREDVGALRYIYRKSNYNVENVATNATGGGGGPWGPPPGTTNTTGTNLVTTALRPGIGNIKLSRLDYDSRLGQFVTFTNSFVDNYVTNGVTRQQGVQRALALPDIVFTAGDLGVDPNGIPFIWFRSVLWGNNSALNTTLNGGTLAGPGEIQPSAGITFSSILPYYYNVFEGSEEQATIGTVWGSFDGTTNAPIVFPIGTSIRDIERLVMQGSGGAWGPPPGGGAETVPPGGAVGP